MNTAPRFTGHLTPSLFGPALLLALTAAVVIVLLAWPAAASAFGRWMLGA